MQIPQIAKPDPDMYYTPIVLFNMLGTAKLAEREFCIINDLEKIRKRQVSRIDHLKYFVNKYRTKPHFFHSVALINWEMMPRADHRTNVKNKEFFAEWNSKFIDAVTGYDMIFDIDAPDLKDAYKDAVNLKAFFDTLRIPYSVNFSGKKGFHFRIGWSDLRKYAPAPLECPRMYKYIAQTIATFLKMKHLDSIYDIKRIIRVPYSLHGSTNLVCLPLDNFQFNHFKKEICTPRNVHEIYPLKNRGLLRRQYPKSNVQKLIDISDTIRDLLDIL